MPQKYEVIFSKTAWKQFRELPKTMAFRIYAAIEKLAEDPRPFGSKKLKSSEDYRIRIGDYRVIYEIKDEILIVEVITVGHRKDVYER